MIWNLYHGYFYQNRQRHRYPSQTAVLSQDKQIGLLQHKKLYGLSLLSFDPIWSSLFSQTGMTVLGEQSGMFMLRTAMLS